MISWPDPMVSSWPCKFRSQSTVILQAPFCCCSVFMSTQSINQSKFIVNRRHKSVHFRMSSILPGTVTEAPLGDQLVICTVEQMCFEPLMKGASGDGGFDFEWQAVPGLGVTTWKAREAVTVFILGTTIRTLSEERIVLVGTLPTTSFDRYVGWWCRRTLNVNEATLYSMRCLTGNQCRARRKWVADERYGAWQTTRAKEFCMCCRNRYCVQRHRTEWRCNNRSLGTRSKMQRYSPCRS